MTTKHVYRMILPSNPMAWFFCHLHQNICGSYYNTNTRFGFQSYKSVSGYISDNNPLPYSNSFVFLILDCFSYTRGNWSMNQDGQGIPWNYILAITSIPFHNLQYTLRTCPLGFSGISCIPSNFAGLFSYTPTVLYSKLCIT